MKSALDGLIARNIARGFKGKLRSGTLRREVPGSGVDSRGDPLPGTTVTFSFEGIRESYDAAYRERAGIPQTDVKILVIAGSIRTTPKVGDQIFIQQQWHKVRSIADIDPATATYTLQCFDIKDPTV